ncbi:MAG: hypothetical protein NHB15_14365 [Methanosarcina barkeri]|nr:hypothetical protein [Methanosarcina sp. ERenArc_MAG2]
MIKKMKQDGELWDLFMKKEECAPILLDKYGRFSYYLSSQINIFEPEISNFRIKNELNSEYPEGRKFAACPTYRFCMLWSTEYRSQNRKSSQRG